MGETRSVNVELSAEALQALESRVESGGYPSISAAIEAAVRLLEQQDGGEDFERWIDVEITERVRASLDDPREPLSADEAEKRIEDFVHRRVRSRA
jgi:Arc/MetJ-type ribon-helix-helix transcriptional regulator